MHDHHLDIIDSSIDSWISSLIH